MNGSADLLSRVNTIIIQPTMRLIFAAGFFVFFWGIIELFWGMRTGSISTEGKQHMLWGVVGMFIMVSVWGIIGIITGTFGIDVSGGSVPTSGNLSAPSVGSTFQISP